MFLLIPLYWRFGSLSKINVAENQRKDCCDILLCVWLLLFCMFLSSSWFVFKFRCSHYSNALWSAMIQFVLTAFSRDIYTHPACAENWSSPVALTSVRFTEIKHNVFRKDVLASSNLGALVEQCRHHESSIANEYSRLSPGILVVSACWPDSDV